MSTIVVFDLDDTLYPERDFAVSGFKAAEAWAHGTLGVSMGLAEEMTRLLDEGHLGPLFGLALKTHYPDHTPEQLADIVRIWRDHSPDIQLFDDAAWALAHYTAQGPLGLITDGTHTMQRRKVEALGIAPMFSEMVFTGALGGRDFHKPHPLAYEKIEAALGSGQGAPRFVYVGDNPAKDFVVPNARGWVSVMVHRPDAPRTHSATKVAPGGQPQHTIANLRQLPEVLGV